VLRCQAKSPAERFPVAEALEQALSPCSGVGDWKRDRAARWWRDADPRTQSDPKSRLTRMA
jgi:hypothetical protein